MRRGIARKGVVGRVGGDTLGDLGRGVGIGGDAIDGESGGNEYDEDGPGVGRSYVDTAGDTEDGVKVLKTMGEGAEREGGSAGRNEDSQAGGACL